MSKIQHELYEHNWTIDPRTANTSRIRPVTFWVTKENLEYSQHRLLYSRGWTAKIHRQIFTKSGIRKAHTHDVRNLFMHER